MASPRFFWGDHPEEEEYYASMGVSNTKSFFQTPYGRLFTQSWIPSSSSSSSRGLIFCSHGYGSDTSWLFQKICIGFAQWGYRVYAADLLGHGQSDGLQGLLADAEATASASLLFFQSIRDKAEHRGMKKFLFGESMGGGLSFLMILQDPKGWDGAIFSAPLFAIPDHNKPSRLRLLAYSLLLGLADTWPVMPQSNVKGNVFKDPAKAQLALSNPRLYRLPGRVGTSRQVMRICEIFEKRCGEIEVPFLVLHGTADNITSPEGGETLCRRARSVDKTLKLYDGFFHSLIQTELDHNSALVLSDIRAWLDARTPPPPSPLTT